MSACSLHVYKIWVAAVTVVVQSTDAVQSGGHTGPPLQVKKVLLNMIFLVLLEVKLSWKKYAQEEIVCFFFWCNMDLPRTKVKIQIDP
ncbi:hypothetical protein ACFL35_01545 [Candidatus Riflebacteria bacterium]